MLRSIVAVVILHHHVHPLWAFMGMWFGGPGGLLQQRELQGNWLISRGPA